MSKWRMMVDIETLSTTPTAQIMSVGVVRFNCETKEFKDEALWCVDFKKSIQEYNFTVDPETVQWWLTQNREVLKSQMQNKISLEEMLLNFQKWVVPNQELWAWGTNFDISILHHAYRTLGIPVPWKYHNIRCCRTIAAAFGMEKEKLDGSYHNAIEDCKSQASVLFNIFDE